MTSFDDIADALAGQAIELPSWALGNSGTRLKVFGQAGVPRDPFEKVTVAAEVHRVTGLAPSVADWRRTRGLPADPLTADADSGYQTRIEAERIGGHQAGWDA